MTTEYIVDKNSGSYCVSHRRRTDNQQMNTSLNSTIVQPKDIITEIKRQIELEYTGGIKDYDIPDNNTISPEQLNGERKSEQIALDMLSNCKTESDLESIRTHYRVYTAFCHDMSMAEDYVSGTYSYGLYHGAVLCLTIMIQRYYMPYYPIVLEMDYDDRKIDEAIKYHHFNESL